MKVVCQQVIVDFLIIYSILIIEMLLKQFNVSREIICCDLSELQVQGKVLCNYGWVKVIYQCSQDSGDFFYMCLKSYYVYKVDIVCEVLVWIDEGMVIVFDVSFICWYFVCQLLDCLLYVFINSQFICQELVKCDQIMFICFGGILQWKYGCYVNLVLIFQLKLLEIDLFIFFCEGIDLQGVLWDFNVFNVDFKLILFKWVVQLLLLIDKSKFNCFGEVRIGYLDDVMYIVLDVLQF